MATYTLRESLHDGIYSLRHNYKFFLVFALGANVLQAVLTIVLFGGNPNSVTYLLMQAAIQGKLNILPPVVLLLFLVEILMKFVLVPILYILPCTCICSAEARGERVTFPMLFHSMKRFFVPTVVFSFFKYLLDFTVRFAIINLSQNTSALILLFVNVATFYLYSQFFICMIEEQPRFFAAVKATFNTVFDNFFRRLLLFLKIYLSCVIATFIISKAFTLLFGDNILIVSQFFVIIIQLFVIQSLIGIKNSFKTSLKSK